MLETVEFYCSGPFFPATVLLLLIISYWMLMAVGAVGFEVFDLDFDIGADTDMDVDVSAAESFLSIGMVTLRWFNLGAMPLMVWLSCFAVCYWATTFVMDHLAGRPEHFEVLSLAALVSVRNVAIGLLPTKLLTQPLRGRFDPKEPNKVADLIGREGVVTSAEVTRKSGQARFAAEASPLLLNVRTVQGIVAKNDQVVIVDYDYAGHIYIVEKLDPKTYDSEVVG